MKVVITIFCVCLAVLVIPVLVIAWILVATELLYAFYQLLFEREEE